MGIWSWLIGAFGGCRHDWLFYTEVNRECRGCRICHRVEVFTPDVGGWTSGHWDEVK